MIHPSLDAYIAVISHLRPQNVQKLIPHLGSATFYIGKGEGNNYLAAGAPSVIESGGLCESRNAAIKDAKRTGKVCIQLSDDISSFGELKISGEKKTRQKISIERGLQQLILELKRSQYFLAGCSPTSNPFFAKPEVTTRHFIVGDCIAIKPTCNLLFDEKMTLKEDYDYTLKHIEKYGGVCRVNSLIPAFIHRTNKGGAVEIRNSKEEKKNITHLKKRWGQAIKNNSRRPNEILINAKQLR